MGGRERGERSTGRERSVERGEDSTERHESEHEDLERATEGAK